MIPVVGTITKSGNQTNVTDYTVSHNVATGTQLLVVCVANSDAGNKNITSGVTYNGVALTLAHQEYDSGDTVGASIWYLVNPPTGTHNCVITVDSTTNSSMAVIVNVSNISDGDAAESNNGTTGTGSPSCAVTTTKPAIVFDCFSSVRTSDLSVGAGQTSLDQITFSGDSNHRGGASYIIDSSAGTTTMAWTGTGTYAHVAAAFNGKNSPKVILMS